MQPDRSGACAGAVGPLRLGNPLEPIMPASNPIVISALQSAVSLHLTAIEQYQSQADHFDRWGYKKLADAAKADAEEEHGHLTALRSRLEFYDAQPTYEHDAPSWPRHDYDAILAANLQLEMKAALFERSAATICREQQDVLSALVFEANLDGSEESIKSIEATQRVISQIGLDNYLANQT